MLDELQRDLLSYISTQLPSSAKCEIKTAAQPVALYGVVKKKSGQEPQRDSPTVKVDPSGAII